MFSFFIVSRLFNLIIFYLCSTTLHYIDEAITKLKEHPPESDINREPSVFEKLVKHDKHYAIIMALDMFLAGVDTVRFIKFWAEEKKRTVTHIHL